MSLDTTLQSCSQLPAEKDVGQLALVVALFTMVDLLKINVLKVYFT